jgi:hypothetical protein
MSRLEEAAVRGDLVIFSGTGVSAGAPTSLPGWKPLNAAIFRVLRKRLEAAVDRKDWLLQMETFLETSAMPTSFHLTTRHR